MQEVIPGDYRAAFFCIFFTIFDGKTHKLLTLCVFFEIFGEKTHKLLTLCVFFAIITAKTHKKRRGHYE